uniref:uncharacterized protein LOC118154738 n=1 Tax=Callithrix jacchus TaxID=9483 RepID=UPI00159E7BDE|nr:uncharacterized protein LOC118154738 [Callithrix jacchus]
MAAAGGHYAGREGLRYSAGVESHALERQRRPPASVKRSVNGEARLTKGRGEEGRGGNKHSSPYRFLLLLHPGGHLGHGPVDGDAVVEIRHVLAAVDRQRFGGVQRPRSEGEFTHCLPALQEQPGRRRRGGRGGGEDSRRLLHLLPQCSAAGPLLLLLTAPGHSMGAHPARKQPPAARGRFHTLDPPLARPIRSLRHGQHGGHYHSGGERSRQPARERAPAAGTRFALSFPPSLPPSSPFPSLACPPTLSAALPARGSVLGLGLLRREGAAAAAPLRSPAGALGVAGARCASSPALWSVRLCRAARSPLSLGVPRKAPGEDNCVEQRVCA